MRPGKTKIKLGNNEYGLLFSINVADAIQDHFDIPIAELGDLLKSDRTVFKALRYILTLLINEAIEDDGGKEFVEERFVGRKINTGNIAELSNKLLESFSASVPDAEEDDFEKNAVSGQN